MQEMRTAALLCKHLARSSAAHHRKYLVLCDSQVVVGACRKMRSSSYPLLRQLWCMAAIFFATGVRLVLRWIPTKENPADGPSRGLPIGHQAATQEEQEEEGPPQEQDHGRPVLEYQRGWQL